RPITVISPDIQYRTISLIFFFQAEDGIRDLIVTGVQTCALPIFSPMTRMSWPAPLNANEAVREATRNAATRVSALMISSVIPSRSEERRVGKECRSRWWPDH